MIYLTGLRGSDLTSSVQSANGEAMRCVTLTHLSRGGWHMMRLLPDLISLLLN